MKKVMTGIDWLQAGSWKRLRGLRLGLLSNQASVDSKLHPTKTVLAELLPGHLKALFGPQHGHAGEDQDNMIETPDDFDGTLGVPVRSLYAATRTPLPHMLEEVDAVIIDLQDVGTRVYTFAATVLNCMKASSALGKKVVILDRPNPLGGEMVEGNLLRTEFFSFVGTYGLPMRHGMTLGELARLYKSVFRMDCDLEVVPMKGWKRTMLWHHTGLRWLMPSPNLPVPESTYVYPGQVVLEGTNLSEGRGTCRPFDIFGAPYLDTEAVRAALPGKALEGCVLQDYVFRPTFNKWKGDRCAGFLLHIIDPLRYRPYLTSLALIQATLKTHGTRFQWKSPPYEYEYERNPIDLIIGDSNLRVQLEGGVDVFEISDSWRQDLEAYLDWRREYFLYD
jgi:uncharacterized protein YbbC (DUF1343 family)